MFPRIITYLLFFLLVYFLSFQSVKSAILTPHEELVSPVVTLEEIRITVTPATPKTLVIPKLKVEAQIEEVGKDGEGRMDIPENVFNAAWYSPGIRPGLNGNAVIAGHFNTPSNAPSIFYDLKKLESGDTITVVDSGDRIWNFQVTGKSEFEDAGFPLDLVFGPGDNQMLNLITCSGVWDKNLKNYSKRLVVFSRLIL